MKKALLFFCIVMMITGWFSCTKDTAPSATVAVCDSTKVSFVKDVKPVFVASCAVPACHDANTRQSGLDYAQYADSKISMQGSGSGSLICRIQGNTCGLQMPEGAPPLADSLITRIIKWQADGYCN